MFTRVYLDFRCIFVCSFRGCVTSTILLKPPPQVVVARECFLVLSIGEYVIYLARHPKDGSDCRPVYCFHIRHRKIRRGIAYMI